MFDNFFRWLVLLSLTASECIERVGQSRKGKRVRVRVREREREKGMGERILSFFLFLTFSSFPQTPLHNAASVGSVECVNALIKHGADVSAKNVRSERVCESASHSRRDVWGFV